MRDSAFARASRSLRVPHSSLRSFGAAPLPRSRPTARTSWFHRDHELGGLASTHPESVGLHVDRRPVEKDVGVSKVRARHCVSAAGRMQFHRRQLDPLGGGGKAGIWARKIARLHRPAARAAASVRSRRRRDSRRNGSPDRPTRRASSPSRGRRSVTVTANSPEGTSSSGSQLAADSPTSSARVARMRMRPVRSRSGPIEARPHLAAHLVRTRPR